MVANRSVFGWLHKLVRNYRVLPIYWTNRVLVLHSRDNARLIDALKNLRDIGNSVLVVEHDKDIMLAADHLVDIGPLAGKHGGEIVTSGDPKKLYASQSATAKFLFGRKSNWCSS